MVELAVEVEVEAEAEVEVEVEVEEGIISPPFPSLGGSHSGIKPVWLGGDMRDTERRVVLNIPSTLFKGLMCPGVSSSAFPRCLWLFV